MDLLLGALESMRDFVPALAMLATAVLVLALADRLLAGRRARAEQIKSALERARSQLQTEA